MDGVQAAHRRWRDHPGQYPDALVQVDQVDLDQHGGQARGRLRRGGSQAHRRP